MAATTTTTVLIDQTPEPHRTKPQEVALGMVLLGVIFSSILYGVMLTQTYKYYERFKRDPMLVKLLVFAVFLLNTASVFFVAHAAWFYLVDNGPRGLSIWSLNVELALSVNGHVSDIRDHALPGSSLSEFTSQKQRHLDERAGKLHNPAPVAMYFVADSRVFLQFGLAILHFGSGEVAAIEFLLLKRFAKFGSVKVPSILRLSSAAVCDTAIAVSLTYFLHKKRTGFKKTDEMINYLILFSINSGLLLSAISIASLITYLVVPRTWVYTALCFLLSRLYATTFLCSLNSRQILIHNDNYIANEKVDNGRIRIQPKLLGSQYWSLSRSSTAERDRTPRTPTQIFVVTETVTDVPQTMDAAKIRNSNSHLKEIMESSDDSSSTIHNSSASSNSSRTS
ncbi:hypothetical protein D9613_008516 [Agrocybe pediades]|uniref:DUF6534 domain-containing protein n=1 Tax=Agrocybe pediades TaxID=84607 RepID=A0A8H4VNL9_9AGAR|nr:hypothetical protein D9613_008516 [Agrocybe pediades]